MVTKRILPAAALALLVLTGCSSAPPVVAGAPVVEAPAAPVEPPAEEAPIEAEPTLREVGIEYLRDAFPEFAVLTDADIDEYAFITCDYFDQGGTFEGSVMSDIEDGFTAEQSGALTGYAIYVYCPEHEGVTQ